jgi:hypothetical protein
MAELTQEQIQAAGNAFMGVAMVQFGYSIDYFDEGIEAAIKATGLLEQLDDCMMRLDHIEDEMARSHPEQPTDRMVRALLNAAQGRALTYELAVDTLEAVLAAARE